MSQVLERERSEYRVPVRRRTPIVDRTLIIIAAVAALVGLYFQFAPANWWLAHFSEAYHLGAYVVAGLSGAAGFGIYADRALVEDGRPSVRTAAGTILAIAALVGAILAALTLF